ncbi:MAG TPA: hypothetical protein VN901_02055 [Candidatus Acidoferrales bacterium]|nr:hypothetical protein [Candidatus Acidoferrales bacterium]
METSPLAVLGFLLLGLAAWQSFVVFRRLEESGHKMYGLPTVWMVTMPLAYLNLSDKSRRGWSAWPAYLVWSSAVAGIVVLAIGLFRLFG